MADTGIQKPDFNFYSSTKNDVWNGPKKGDSYEWWYFDALSDDSKDAVVIIFLDNFVFSPRYNRGGAAKDTERPSIPAVAFSYYREGKPLYRVIAEFDPSEFESRTDVPGCRIGKSSFDFKAAPYGYGYAINLNLPLKGGKRLEASFEWLTIESDLKDDAPIADSGHSWNLVSPRCDVTGKIRVYDGAKKLAVKKFRGTGYHDHNSDRRWLPDAISEWSWGRAHFPYTTAIFYRFLEKSCPEQMSKMFLVKDGNVSVIDTEGYVGSDLVRDKFGLRYPRKMKFSGPGVELEVSDIKVIDSSFFYLRFTSEMTLRTESESSTAAGISEFLKSDPLKRRIANWLVDFRIAKGGKSAFLK